MFKKAPENKIEKKNTLTGLATMGALLVLLAQDAKLFAAPNENAGENTIEMAAPVTPQSHLEKMKSLDDAGDTVVVNFSNRTTTFESSSGEYVLTVVTKEDGTKMVYADIDKDGDVDTYKRTGGGIEVYLDLNSEEFNGEKKDKITEDKDIDYMKTAENIQNAFHNEISNLDKIQHAKKAKLAALELEKKNKGVLTANI